MSEFEKISKNGKITRRELLKLALPHALISESKDSGMASGKVKLDGSRCMGCWLCARDCPAEALVVSSNEETGCCQLLFRQQRCDACGTCVAVCPEKCLRLEQFDETQQIEALPSLLFEDEVVRCRECGCIIGAGAMISALKTKIASNDALASLFELCPSCKTRVSFTLGNNKNVA